LKQALRLIRKPKELSPQEERRKLEKKLADAKIAVVVLIDELDRVEDDEVRAVAQLVKAIGDIKGISYLVAYDPERVADALGRGSGDDRRRTGEA
ncbi:P-loop NTPase fold protein, partial [Staphylococcus shinii]|uniref:P-loop NTPase fold protein n=1 Tax=Staphylococcus shinii TaxID=2912228 RepID=UPI003F459751